MYAGVYAGVGVLALVGTHAVRQGVTGLRREEGGVLSPDANAHEIANFVTSLDCTSCDDLVEDLAKHFTHHGVHETLLRRLPGLLKHLSDPAGLEAFSLTVVYSTMLHVIRENPGLLKEATTSTTRTSRSLRWHAPSIQ